MTDRVRRAEHGDHRRGYADDGPAARSTVPAVQVAQDVEATQAAKFSAPVKMAGLTSILADVAKLSMSTQLKVAGFNSALAQAARFSAPTQLKMAGFNSALAQAARFSAPTQLKMAGFNSALAQAARFSAPTQLKMAGFNSALAQAARFSAPTQLKMAGFNSALAQAAKFSAPAKMAGLTSILADVVKLSMSTQLKVAGFDSALAQAMSAARYFELGEVPEGVSAETDVGPESELIRTGTIYPEVFAGLMALIVLNLLIGFWLSEANRTGSEFLTLNRFGLLADGSFVCGATAAAYRVALTIMRKLND